MVSDEELFALMKEGHSEALAQLYDRYVYRVYAIARKVVLDPQMADEVVQDVFTRIWTTVAFDPKRGQFEHWIMVVTKNVALDNVRKKGRQKDIPDSLRIYGEREGNPHATDAVNEWALREDLQRSLEGLRVEERAVLQLAYMEGCTLSEVATKLSIPLGTVKTRLHHGLHHMRSMMDAWAWGGQG
ncbi:MAG: sigma-70 family RNA polymerase sigma factor [Acidibacillus sp.]|uniref:ECF RNA polymerase sigma factor SigK n=1 Tax=Sulfoacidibacillus ferrooxidans TaxID=2005001 RepID=A0A9X2ADR0_9BACL|nr:ECF RNA polymerase sigma factor SigK [Sulfoacidibacillus ferrooxidans]MCY0892217.1 sigma-70 family RNA polymerase sigma factor [Acidibacillus sp.]